MFWETSLKAERKKKRQLTENGVLNGETAGGEVVY